MSLLLAELAALSSEAKRKSPEVKAASDQVLAKLKADQDAVLSAKSKSPDDDLLLKPILLACNTKTTPPKVVSIAVGLLQRLIGLRAVPENERHLSTIVDLLTNVVASRSDVDIHLKVLQVVSSLLSTFSSIHNALLSRTLQLCFRLQESRIGVVSSTAAATLRQSVMTVFDKVKAEDAVLDGIQAGGEDAAAAAPLAAMTVQVPEKGPVTLFPCSRDAYMTIDDLNKLANGSEAPFLRLESLPRTFVLELIESILTNHAHLFRADSHPELLLCLRESTCPLLIRALSEEAVFPTTLRLMRLLFVLLRQFSRELVVEVEILLSILLRFVTPSKVERSSSQRRISNPFLSHTSSSASTAVPHWQRVLAMEAMRSLCSDGELLRNLWKWFDGSPNSAKVFTNLVDAIHLLAIEDTNAIGKAEASDQMSGDQSSNSSRQSQDRARTGLYGAAAGVATAMLSSASSATTEAGAGLSQTSMPGIQLIDQLDKSDAPHSPPTYLYLLALQSLVHLAQSIASYVLPSFSRFANARPKTAPRAPPALDFGALQGSERVEMEAVRDMVLQAWAPLMTSLTFFLSSKCDEILFSEALVALRNFTNATGVLGLESPRDALIASLARFAVPRQVLIKLATTSSSMLSSGFTGQGGEGGDEEKDSSSLSEKNAACLKAVTQIAYYLSGSLGTHWRDVLETLCDAEFVLRRGGRKRRASTKDGSVNAASASSYEPKASMSSISALSTIPPSFFSTASRDPVSKRPMAMTQIDTDTLLDDVARVFENTQALGAQAFLSFIEALCALDADSTGVAAAAAAAADKRRNSSAEVNARATNRSFPLSSLSLVSMLNVARLTFSAPEMGWDLVCAHLHAVLSQGQLRPSLRTQAAEALDALLFAAISAKNSKQESVDDEERKQIQSRTILALSKQALLEERRAVTADVDVRRMGLETLLRILEAHGHALLLGWETIFDMCAATCSPPPEGSDSDANVRSSVPLVKVGFTCLQMVCSDLLASLSLSQLEQCVSTLTKYGAQAEDVNVALTANGTLWGITAEVSTRAAKGSNQDNLWVFVLRSVLQLTSDERAEVRQGAISLLFNILEQYGAAIQRSVWSGPIIHDILFPLLVKLRTRLDELRDSPVKVDERADRMAATMGQPGSASKQWEESRVLALSNFGKVVSHFFVEKLIQEGEEARIEDTFRTLFAELSLGFLGGPNTVSQASIKALDAIVSVQTPSKGTKEHTVVAKLSKMAWDSWCNLASLFDQCETPLSQANLLAYVQTVSPIYKTLQDEGVTLEEHVRLLESLKVCITYTSSKDNVPDVDSLSPLQSSVRSTIFSLDLVPGLRSKILNDLAEYATLAFTPSDRKTPTYVALNKVTTNDLVKCFFKWQREKEIFVDGAVSKILSSLLVPVKLRYDCPSSASAARIHRASKINGTIKDEGGQGGVGSESSTAPLWQSATVAFCKVASLACQRMDEDLPEHAVADVWTHLGAVIEASLTVEYDPQKEAATNEFFDIVVFAMLERAILPHLGDRRVPSSVIEGIARALEEASRLTSTDNDMPHRHQHPQRELFSYWAFEALLLACHDGEQGESRVRRGERKRVALFFLPYLKRRMEGVLQSYLELAPLKGKEPMQRVREEELNFVLSALLDLRLLQGGLTHAKLNSSSLDGGDANEKLQHWLEEDDSDISRGSGIKAPESDRALVIELYRSLCDVLLLPRGSDGGALKRSTAGSSRLGDVKELQRALTRYSKLVAIKEKEEEEEGEGAALSLGKIGSGNVLESPRLERRGLQEPTKLVRALLDVAGSFLV